MFDPVIEGDFVDLDQLKRTKLVKRYAYGDTKSYAAIKHLQSKASQVGVQGKYTDDFASVHLIQAKIGGIDCQIYSEHFRSSADAVYLVVDREEDYTKILNVLSN